MPALPKKKHSRARKNKRRSQDKIDVGSLILCSHCRRPHLAHHVCPNCGYYRGREVVVEKPDQAPA